LRVELHPAAEAEARAAWLRYHEYDPAVASRFMLALGRAIDAIDAGPERWPRYLPGTRRLVRGAFRRGLRLLERLCRREHRMRRL
jgi:hypothetical protein